MPKTFYQHGFKQVKGEMLRAALGYLAVGWSIFPLEPGSKTSSVDWRQFQNRLPTVQEVLGWWEKMPNAGIGLVCGQISGVMVLNCDTARAQQAVYDLSPAGQKFLAAATFKGSHFYFRWQAGVGCSVGNFEEFGVVGEGGFVVLPPSRHPSGESYRWMHPQLAVPRVSDRLLTYIRSRQAEIVLV